MDKVEQTENDAEAQDTPQGAENNRKEGEKNADHFAPTYRPPMYAYM